jgi:hypothetical protein
MNRARRSPWPPEMGPNTPHDRARRVARGWRDLAVKHCPPELVAQMDDACRRFSEADWLLPSRGDAEGEWLTRAQVATRGGVRPSVVSEWSTRGITDRRLPVGDPNRNVKLVRYPDGYDPQEVADFLSRRDRVTAPGLTDPKGSRACLSSRSPLSRVTSIPAQAAPAGTGST